MEENGGKNVYVEAYKTIYSHKHIITQ